MKHVKAIVIALILTLAAVAYGSAQSQPAKQKCDMMEADSYCKSAPPAQLAALAVKQQASACCEKGSDCCALDCCKAGADCCSAVGGCKANAACCGGHACCTAKSSGV